MSGTIHPLGDEALLVRFGTAISPQAHERVRSLVLSLAEDSLPFILDYTAAYASVLVRFDAIQVSSQRINAALERRIQALPDAGARARRKVEIPVCYGDPYGPDLEGVANLCGLTVKEVITLHSDAFYRVEFIGFAPGFPYLSGLDPRLQVPRLEQPRRRVPMGSVAIAGTQTGIYSRTTAGGWQIIGRTPMILFDVSKTKPSLLTFGDEVTFVPISQSKMEAWR